MPQTDVAHDETRQALVHLYQSLAGRQMLIGSSGNLSARTSSGFLITPTGCDDSLTADQIVPMRLDGRYEGALKPSSEWQLHAAIFAAAPNAGWIVHTHSDAATALSCLNMKLPAFHYNVAEFGGEDVRCAPYATFGTPALAHLAAQAIAGRSACLLANHGMICHAPTAQAAQAAAIRLEALCRQYLLALSAGRPRLLTQTEMTDAIARYASYGQQESPA
jgi:L-fuculose-phosphate aldolase